MAPSGRWEGPHLGQTIQVPTNGGNIFMIEVYSIITVSAKNLLAADM